MKQSSEKCFALFTEVGAAQRRANNVALPG
jgi:hypothetical protein